MTDAALADALPRALHRARILTGERDGELEQLGTGAAAGGSKDTRKVTATLEQAQRRGLDRLQQRLELYAREAGDHDSGSGLIEGEGEGEGESSSSGSSERDNASADALADALAQQLGLSPLQQAQVASARAALRALGDVHGALLPRKAADAGGAGSAADTKQDAAADADADADDDPQLGLRDRATLGVLLGLWRVWGLDAAAAGFDAAWRAAAAASAPGAGSLNAHATGAPARFTELPAPSEAAAAAQRLRAVSRAAGALLLEPALGVLGFVARSSPAAAVGTGSAAVASAPPSLAPRTEVARAMLEHCAGALLKLALRLGHPLALPQPQARSEPPALSAPPAHVFQALLRALPTLACIAALNLVAAPSPAPAVTSGPSGLGAGEESPAPAPAIPPPPFVAVQATRFLAAQLLRPDGVRAMLGVLLQGGASLGSKREAAAHEHEHVQGRKDERKGSADRDADGDAEADADAPVPHAQLQRITKLLLTPPAGLAPDAFARAAVPQLLDIMAQLSAPASAVVEKARPPASHGTAAARALAAFARGQPAALKEELEHRLCFPFTRLHTGSKAPADAGDTAEPALSASAAVLSSARLLATLGSFSEPDPSFLGVVIEPYAAALLSLAGFLGASAQRPKIMANAAETDALRRALVAALRTWARMAPPDTLARVLGTGDAGALSEKRAELDAGSGSGARWKWAWDARTRPCAVLRDSEPAAETDGVEELARAFGGVTLGLSHTLDGDAEPELDQSKAGALVQAVDPTLSVVQELLDYVGDNAVKLDVVGQLLDAYIDTERRADRSPRSLARSIALLSAVSGYLEDVGGELIAQAPDKVLAFVDHALDADPGEGLQPPTLIAEQHIRPAGEQGAEDAQAAIQQASEVLKSGMRPAAATLLGDLLLKHPEMTTSTKPLLRSIEHKLKHLALESEDPTARQAYSTVLVYIGARSELLAQRTGDAHKPKGTQVTPTETAEAQYKEALQLLQDPVVPVRAHGIVLLRELVASLVPGSKSSKGTDALQLDRERLPSILSLLLRAVADDDSYVYLNAVKALAQFGLLGEASMLQRLVKLYTTGQDEDSAPQPLTVSTVDKRLRIGEALQQVVQQTGEALAPRINLLVLPLMAFLRDPRMPIPLRVSSISLLGTIVEATPFAVAAAGYGDQLAATSLDLLEVESVPRHANDESAPSLQDDALALDTKLPELRRAALLLLALLVGGSLSQLEAHRLKRAGDAEVSIGSAPETLQALRLPGGGMLPSINGSQGSRPRISVVDDGPPPVLVDRSSIPRIKRICTFLSQSEDDPVAREQATDCLETAIALETDFNHAGLVS